MGATELQTFLISSLVGLAAGYALHCSGESVYEFYRQHKSKIVSNMAKNASDNVGSLVEEMVDDVDDLAVESQYKNADTLTKTSGVLDDAADDLAVKTQDVNLDKTSYGKASDKYKNTLDYLKDIKYKNGNYYADKSIIDEIGQMEAKGEDFSILNKKIMHSRASTEGGTSIVYRYSDEYGTKYMIHEVTDANGYIIHRDFDAVRITSGQLINKGK